MEDVSLNKPDRVPRPGDQTFYFASIGTRFVALLIDGFIMFFVNSIVIGIVGFFLAASNDTFMGNAAPFGPLNFLGIILIASYITFFLGTYGQTPGKMLLRVKVVTYEGTIPSYGTALLRYVVSVFSGTIFFIGYITAFFNPQHQTWHDMAAKTYVVNV